MVASSGNKALRTRLCPLVQVATVAFLTACGSASSTSTSGGAGASATQSIPPSTTSSTSSSAPGCSGSGACVSLQVTLSGDVTVSGSEQQPRNSCADLLKADKMGGQFVLTLPLPEQPISGHEVKIFPGIYPWTGPGTYTTHDISLTGEDGLVTVDGGHYLDSAPGSSTPVQLSATVRADGSGTVSFVGLLRQDDLSRKVSGSLTWTCRPA